MSGLQEVQQVVHLACGTWHLNKVEKLYNQIELLEKKQRTPPPPCGGHRRPAEPACEHTGRGQELEPDQEAK